MEVQKVYLVTAGIYSDYHICAAFSTKERAQAYIDEHTTLCDEIGERGSGYLIEPYDLDLVSTTPPDGYPLCQIAIDRHGNTNLTFERARNPVERRDFLTYFDDPKKLVLVVIGPWKETDRLRAVKIANESRIQWLASGTWPRYERE